MTSTFRLDPTRPPAVRLRRAPTTPAEDFRTPVRGHAFAARPPAAPAPEAGVPAELVREPDNPRDPLAVAVWTTGERPWRIGYLDRAVAARLAPRLDTGQRFRAELAGWVDAPGSAWRRPLLRVVTTPGPRQATAPPPSPGDVPAGVLSERPPRSTRRTVSRAR